MINFYAQKNAYALCKNRSKCVANAKWEKDSGVLNLEPIECGFEGMINTVAWLIARLSTNSETVSITPAAA